MLAISICSIYHYYYYYLVRLMLREIESEFKNQMSGICLEKGKKRKKKSF